MASLQDRIILIAAILVVLLPSAHASLNDNVEVYVPFDQSDGSLTLDVAGGREVSCFSPGMSAPDWSIEAGHAVLNNTYCVIPALDMGDVFTVCTRFKHLEYQEALLSSFGHGFERSGGAFELFISPNWDAGGESLEVGAVIDNTPDDSPDTIAIERHSTGVYYGTGDWHTVCSSYDGGTVGESLQIYFDGSAPSSMPLTFGSYLGGYNKSRDLVIQAANPDGELVCPLCLQDTIIVYKNRVLGPQEIADLTQRLANGEDYPFQESVSALDQAIAQEYELYVQTLEEVQVSADNGSASATLADAGITPGQMKLRLESAVADSASEAPLEVFALMATPLESAILEESLAPALSTAVDVAVEDEYVNFQQTLDEVKRSLQAQEGRSVSAILAEAGISPGRIKQRLEEKVVPG